MALKDSLKSTCLQVLEAGPVLCASQDGRTTAQYGQQVAHANLSARQAKENNLMMSGTYGPPFIGLQASNALSLYLANSLQAKMQKSGSTLYKLTWKVWAMPSGRRRFRLRASVRRTSGSVLTGWPTPRQEKRELAQRLSDDVRTKRKTRPPEREEGAGLSVKEQQISELLALRGIDASAGMVRSMMAGASVACGDLVMTVQDGRLVSRNRAASGLDKLPSQVMAAKQKTSDLVNRMKAAFSRN